MMLFTRVPLVRLKMQLFNDQMTPFSAPPGFPLLWVLFLVFYKNNLHVI
jgi:hypothetical protein